MHPHFKENCLTPIACSGSEREVLCDKTQLKLPQERSPSTFQGEGWDGGESCHQYIDLNSYAIANSHPHPSPPPEKGRGFGGEWSQFNGLSPSPRRQKVSVFRPSVSQHHRGFTLIELIVVITITGILAASATLFIRNPTQSYFDIETRAGLSDSADGALRRMGRDIHNALPNSVRVTTNGADSFIEFIPVKAAGRYRAAVGTGAENPLDFTLAADTFDVLGNPVTVAAGDKLVIYNLGVSGADAYEGTNIRALQTTGSLQTLSFAGGTFPLPSPSSRFYVVSTASTYMCDMTNHVLRLFTGYAIPTTQPASLATLQGLTTSRLIANNVTACSITYLAGVSQRSGIVNIAIELSQNNAAVRLMQQVGVMNSP